MAKAAFVWILGEYGQGIQVRLCARCRQRCALCRSRSTIPSPSVHPDSKDCSYMAKQIYTDIDDISDREDGI